MKQAKVIRVIVSEQCGDVRIRGKIGTVRPVGNEWYRFTPERGNPESLYLVSKFDFTKEEAK